MSNVIQVGDVSIGKLKWKAYKRLKSQIIEMLTKDSKTFMEALQLGVEGDFSGVCNVVVGAVSELNILFVQGCIVESPAGFDLEDCDVSQVSELFAAALKLNPLEELLEHEKNSPTGGLIQSLLKTLGDLPVSGQDGGSLLSQFLQGSMAGLSQS